MCPTVLQDLSVESKTTANDGFPIATHYSLFGLCVIRQHRANMPWLTPPRDILVVCCQCCVQQWMVEHKKIVMYIYFHY